MPGPLTVAVTAFSSPFEVERFQAGIERVERLGVRVRVDDEVYARENFLAGDDDHRAAHLTALLSDAEVDLIWLARGGYGSLRLLGRIDPALVNKSPKKLLGFSDATAMLGMWAAWGGPALHGPVVTQVAELDEPSLIVLAEVLKGGEPPDTVTGKESIGGGVAEGKLMGGNLATLGSLCGTPFFPDLRGAVLLLEDVSEVPYKLDRLLTQLILSGGLEGVTGVALGSFSNCGDEQDVKAVFSERLGNLGVPIVWGLPMGHGPTNLVTPLGRRVRLDGDAARMEGVD